MNARLLMASVDAAEIDWFKSGYPGDYKFMGDRDG